MGYERLQEIADPALALERTGSIVFGWSALLLESVNAISPIEASANLRIDCLPTMRIPVHWFSARRLAPEICS